jgi:hypothetical protein
MLRSKVTVIWFYYYLQYIPSVDKKFSLKIYITLTYSRFSIRMLLNKVPQTPLKTNQAIL